MRIGTAAPTDEELAAVPHHLVGVVPPDAHWSLAGFLARARTALDDIWSRGKLPLVAGGTGQYVWALLEGWQPPAVPPDFELRVQLEGLAAEQGIDALYRRLEGLDAEAAARIDRRNPRRLIRAIEVAFAGGRAVARPRGPDFMWAAVGLKWSREALHARADERVEQMYAAGLVEETCELLQRYPADLPAFQSIGYAEAARVVNGEWTLDEAIARTKIATHRLIRMQATWFRRDDSRIEWVDGSNLEAVVSAVEAAARRRVR
jgi:tRNA dimethylallyltransferase